MPTHPMVTHAKAGIFKPLEHMNCHVTTTSPLPCSHVHALRHPNWKEATLDEYNTLITNKTWDLVTRPANVNMVRSMWLFKLKLNADGSLSKYKVRLVANGRSQQQGIDCDGTFNPVVKPATIRTVLSLAVSRSDISYLLLYVDDIILKASSSAFLQRIIASLYNEFAMNDFGSLNYFLDLSYVVQHVCLYMHDPRDPHFTALKRILRYVRGTLDYGLQLPVTFSRSSAEAEYRGVANVVAESAWIRNLLCELHTPLFTATLVYCDNVSVVYMSANLVQHQRMKHIEIDIHFVCDFVASGQDIYAAGSESRHPMLNKENYVPWSSRLLWYAKSRQNRKLIHNSILNGPYVRRMIPEPGDAERDVN
nr:hypothetical protein [Tanacetum cinerariifolium]